MQVPRGGHIVHNHTIMCLFKGARGTWIQWDRIQNYNIWFGVWVKGLRRPQWVILADLGPQVPGVRAGALMN